MECRKGNLDLLRCISMYLVVVLHNCVHGLQYSNLQNNTYNIANNTPYIVFLVSFSSIAVNIFFMISGYFHSGFKLKKLVNLYFEVGFWAGICYLIYIIFVAKNKGGLFIEFLRLGKNTVLGFSFYWFIIAYITIYVVSGFVIKGLNALSNVELNKLIVILLIVEVFFGFCFKSVTYGGPRTILPSLTMYILGYWIYRYQHVVCLYRKTLYVGYVISLLIVTALGGYFIYNKKYQWGWEITTDYYNPLIIFMSFGVFIFFLNLKVPANLLLKRVSASTFAVYLISDNTWIRSFIYVPIVDIISNIPYRGVIIAILIYSAALFIICIVLDILRKSIVSKLLHEGIFVWRKK